MSVAEALRNRVKFVEIDESTLQSLQEFRGVIEEVLPVVLEKFYAYISEWPNLAGMFKDQSRVDYARSAQTTHWLKLFSGLFDQDYTDSVRKIGLVHSRIGLEPTWYVGAYAYTLSRLYPAVVTHYAKERNREKAGQKIAAVLRALNQCVMIDMDMAITVYLEENKKSYDQRLENLAADFESNIGGIVGAVSSASTELEASAKSLNAMATQTSQNATSVASAAEEASANATAVSSATEEMSVSIVQVADMANKSSTASQSAADQADHSSREMEELKNTIDKVSDVANFISDIAQQTNLLALNATIEAARAGDAGKGFAVVASEVKALANETGKATEDIRNQVAEILAKSEMAVKSIASVKGVIDQVREASISTAESVEQQKLAMSEIAKNVEQTSGGTRQISTNIVHISKTARETGNAAEQVLEAVSSLAQQGEMLRKGVNDFISNIKKMA